MIDKITKHAGRKSADKREVLIVDDTIFNLELLAEILSGEGFEVRTAANGESGLRSVEESPLTAVRTSKPSPESISDSSSRLKRVSSTIRTSHLSADFRPGRFSISFIII